MCVYQTHISRPRPRIQPRFRAGFLLSGVFLLRMVDDTSTRVESAAPWHRLPQPCRPVEKIITILRTPCRRAAWALSHPARGQPLALSGIFDQGNFRKDAWELAFYPCKRSVCLHIAIVWHMLRKPKQTETSHGQLKNCRDAPASLDASSVICGSPRGRRRAWLQWSRSRVILVQS